MSQGLRCPAQGRVNMVRGVEAFSLGLEACSWGLAYLLRGLDAWPECLEGCLRCLAGRPSAAQILFKCSTANDLMLKVYFIFRFFLHGCTNGVQMQDNGRLSALNVSYILFFLAGLHKSCTNAA